MEDWRSREAKDKWGSNSSFSKDSPRIPLFLLLSLSGVLVTLVSFFYSYAEVRDSKRDLQQRIAELEEGMGAQTTLRESVQRTATSRAECEQRNEELERDLTDCYSAAKTCETQKRDLEVRLANSNKDCTAEKRQIEDELDLKEEALKTAKKDLKSALKKLRSLCGGYKDSDLPKQCKDLEKI